MANEFRIKNGLIVSSGTVTLSTFTLPASLGSNGDVLRIPTGGGTTLEWASFTEVSSGGVTAVNNFTENRLTTVGSTTSELDGEANLTFDGSALQVTGTLTVGVDDTGHDVKFFGATSGSYMLWDQSQDDLILGGAARLGIGTTSPAKLLHLESTMPEIYMVDSDATNTPNVRIFNNNGSLNFRADDGDTGTGGHILWYTSGTEKMRLSDTGNLGIGTTSPVSELDLNTGALSFANTNTQIKMTNGNADFQLTHWGNAHVIIDADGNDTNRYFSVRHGNTTAGSATELMRVQEDGNVGIGTSSPQSLLDVRGAAGSPGTLTLSTAETTVVDGDKLGRIDFNAPSEADGTDAILIGASIWAEADATFSAVNNRTELVFATGASEAAAEQMRLTFDGKLGIGTATPSRALDVNGDIVVRGNDILDSGVAAAITFDGSQNTSFGGNVTVSSGTFTVGVDDTGRDVKFFGATTGAYLEWDESADELELRGGAATPGKLLLSTAETTVVDGDKLGRIDFQAPLDSAGTDAIVVGASIWAEADDTFAADNNETELVFATAASGAVSEAMRISSGGDVGIGNEANGGYKLDVQSGTVDSIARFKSGDANGRILIQDNDDTVYVGTTSGYGYFGGTSNLGSGANLVIHKTTGNVGLGSTSPSTRLHIADDTTSLFTGLLVENEGSDGNSATVAGIEIKNSAGTDSSTHIEQDAFGITRMYTGQGAKNEFLHVSASAGTFTIAGDLKLGGNDIQASDGTTAITTSGANVTVAGVLSGLDGKLQLGSSGQLDIDFDGSHTRITHDAATDSWMIFKNEDGAGFQFNIGTDKGIEINKDGNVELYYDNSKKIETTTAGATVTGTLTATVTGDVTGDLTGNADTATLATTVTVSDSTANTNFPVVFHDESNALLDDTGALRYNPSTGTLLVPNLNVAGTTTQVNTVTMNAQNAVVFEGATADAYETTLTITDPTADRTITLPNASGTIALTGNNVAGLNATNDRDLAPEDLSYSNDFNVFFTSKEGLEDGSTSGSNYQDAIVLNTWSDGTGGDANLLAFDKSEMKIYHYQADQAATDWGTAKTIAYTSDVTAAAGDGLTLANGANNRIVTATGSAGLNGESNLTFDGSTLALTGDFNVGSGDLFVDDSSGRVGIGQTSPDAPLDVVASLDPSGSDTQFTYAETLKLNVRDSDSDEGPAIRFRHGATSDHNAADYMFQVNGDGGSMAAYEYGFNYGFNKWYLANSADGTKPLMKFDSGGSGSAGQTMYGELLITSTATAWDVYDGTHTGISPTTFDSQIFLSGGAASYINNGQNFGIGTTSPSDALHIRAASDHPLVIENTTNAGYAGIQFSDNSTGSYAQKGEFRFNHADSNSEGSGASFHFTTTESDLSIVGGKFISAVGSASEPGFSFSGDTNVGMFRPATNELAFSVVNEAMRIDSSGNVGIGSDSPLNKLVLAHTGADGDNGMMIVRVDSTTANNDLLGGIGFDSSDGNAPSSVLEASVAIVAKAREDHSVGDKGGYMEFMYSPTDQDDDSTSTVGMTFIDGKLAVNNFGVHPLTSFTVFHQAGDFNDGMTIINRNTTISSGDLLGAIGFDARDGNAPSRATEASAGIAAFASQDHSATEKGGHLTFFTAPDDQDDDTASSERMRILSDGKVGIGTTSPEEALQVEGNIRIHGGSGGKGAQLDFGDDYRILKYTTSDTLLMSGPEDVVISIDNNNNATTNFFAVGNNDREEGDTNYNELFRVQEDGNVGIGTTSPDGSLHIAESGHQTLTLERTVNNTNYGSGIHFQLGDSASTTAGHNYAAMYGVVEDNTNGAEDGYIAFHTSLSGTLDERMRITSAGRLGIGTTSPARPLHVVGDAYVQSGDILLSRGNYYLQDASDGTKRGSFSSDGVWAWENVNVGIGTTSPSHKLEVNGSFAATTKSFDIEHPTEEGKRLKHGSLEGPEHGVYIRGRLEGDVIELPDYWTGLVDADSVSVQLTANKTFQQLYVEKIDDNKVYVGTQTDTPIDCFYFIQAERKDVEKMVVEY